MRKNSESIKMQEIKVHRSISNNERENLKKEQSQKAVNGKHIKKILTKKEEKHNQDELISDAYKNVINVIANLLDNIKNEKTNGKPNLQYINETQKKKKSISKKPAKRLISYTPQSAMLSFNQLDKKCLVNKKPLLPQKSFNIIKKKNQNMSSNLDSSINMDKRKKKIISFKSLNSNPLKAKNLFFKPKNKLKKKWISSKAVFSDDNEMYNESSFLSKTPKINNEEGKLSNKNKFNNASSLLGSEFGFGFKTNSQNSKRLSINSFKGNSQQKTKSSFRSNIINSSRSERNSKKRVSVSPFETLEKNINVDTETIKQRLYEYENNEITHQINQLPDDYILKTKKRIQKKKNMNPFNDGLKSIISLKPLRNNYVKNMKQFHKENKYRFLLAKGHVYDSLDDDEEFDEEEINSCYLEPNSILLYIMDSITFISSQIMMIYFPICLAKRKFFCQNLNKEEFIFYSIDIIYILDIIINFYRSYYNYNEILIKNNMLICLHYFKTWLLIDLISAIPFYSIIKSNETKCLGGNIYNDYKLSNSGKHSNYYNTNIQNIHYLITFLKILKSIKAFKHNLAAKKIKKYFFDIDYFYDWGSVFLYTFFFFIFLNFGACFFIFIGRNSINSWIFLNGLEEENFICIYLGAIHYLIETVTTVGYGDVIGKSIKEICFQVIMLIAGTCIYSWLISSVSNYVKKMNEKNIKYEEKIQILEEIKLNNPNFTEELYDKILRLLHYRKYHEEETEKNIVLNSIPNSLKNLLVIEMYKSFINGFLFFKGIENREFIVQIISKLKPVLGIKGEVLIQEGEFIEDIIFVKNGVLSLEIWIDLNFPKNSIEDYLIEYGFFNDSEIKKLKKDINNKEKSTFLPSSLGDNYNTITENTNFNKFYYFKKDRIILEEHKKKIKVLNIRKNQHFGDVYMFLNKKSPLFVRVKSNKADLLLLKKLDALKISSNYPNIWKNILKKPLENTKIINNLTIKALSIFCNFYGIKTTLFKRKKNNKTYPLYYLIPSLNHKKTKHLKKKIKKKGSEDLFENGKREGINLTFKKFIKKITNKDTLEKDEEEKEEKEEKESNIKNDSNNETNSNIDYEDSDMSPNKRRKGGQRKSQNFTFSNKSKDSPSIGISKRSNNNNMNYNQINQNFTFTNNKDKNNSLKKENDNSSYKSKIHENEGDDSSYNYNSRNFNDNSSYNFDPNNDNKSSNIYDKNNSKKCTRKRTLENNKPQNKFKIIINKPEEESDSIIKNEINNKLSNNNLNLVINDEIYPDELFNLELFDDKESKNLIKERNIISNNVNINHKSVLSDGIYIKNLNIIGTNYLGSSSEKNKGLQDKIKKLEFELKQKKKFVTLEISSSESTLEIDSSYENINEISNNKYIYDNDLRDMTKKFIIKKSKLPNKVLISSFDKNKRHSSIALENYSNLKNQIISNKNKSTKNGMNALTKVNINKDNIQKEEISNDLMDKFLKSIQISSNNQAESFINKVRKLEPSKPHIEHSFKESSQLYPENPENFLLDKKKNYTLKDEKDFDIKKYEVFAKKNPENDSLRKKKKNNELDIIQLNIQKSSQNLNQPDVFYAGLFSQLIFKGSSYENTHLNDNSNNYNNNNSNINLKYNEDSSFFSEKNESS